MFRLQDAQVTIVGLGLMGGSMAMALRPHVARLTAVELDAETRSAATASGLVERATPDLANGLHEADLVVLATPVSAILRIIELLPTLRPDGCYLLDLGSTKGTICEAMERLPAPFAALGGHPMCGKEASGLQAAEATLFWDQTFILCRTERTNRAMEHVALSIVEAVQARPLFLEPVEHDHLVALVSHLPYFVASLLMQHAASEARDNAHVWRASASGFRDTTRLAGSDPRMMADIVRTNRAAILARLYQYRRQIEDLVRLLEDDGDEELLQWLADRRREHGLYRSKK